MLSLSTSLLDMDENDASSKFPNRYFRNSQVILFEKFQRKARLRTFSPVVRDRIVTVVSVRGNKSVQQYLLVSTTVYCIGNVMIMIAVLGDTFCLMTTAGTGLSLSCGGILIS
jgi:hypothetical protein